jgi:hypothetical protein
VTGLRLSEADVRESKAPRGADRRNFVHASHTPPDALAWRTPAQRNKALWPWREAVNRKFAERPRCLRVAWLLDCLFGEDGYAFATDSWFERKICLPVNKVQEALLALEQGLAIIRASAIVEGKAQRRIWPSSLIIPPTVGNMDTPHRGCEIPPTVGRHTQYYRKSSQKNGLSTTALAARRAATLRETKGQDRESMRADGALAEGPAKPHPALTNRRAEDLGWPVAARALSRRPIGQTDGLRPPFSWPWTS